MKKIICGIATVALVAAFVFMALGSSSSNNNSSSGNQSSAQSSQSSAQQEATEKTTFTVGETLNASGLKVTMEKVEEYTSDNQFMEPAEGNKYFRAYFTFVNESGKDRFVSSLDFDCYADGVACDTAYFTDESLSSDTISNGRSTKGYVYYEVPKNAKDIEIEYETSWWTSKKAIFKVTL